MQHLENLDNAVLSKASGCHLKEHLTTISEHLVYCNRDLHALKTVENVLRQIAHPHIHIYFCISNINSSTIHHHEAQYPLINGIQAGGSVSYG